MDRDLKCAVAGLMRAIEHIDTLKAEIAHLDAVVGQVKDTIAGAQRVLSLIYGGHEDGEDEEAAEVGSTMGSGALVGEG